MISHSGDKHIYSLYRQQKKGMSKGGSKQLNKRKVWWEFKGKAVANPWKG
jgi:hypothetical protein